MILIKIYVSFILLVGVITHMSLKIVEWFTD